MRVPAWALLAWVFMVVIVASVGSYAGYTQARTRTQELNEIFVSESGTDIEMWRTMKLLVGLEEPRLPDTVGDDILPPLQSVYEPTPTSAPDTRAPDGPIQTPGPTPIATAVTDETLTDTIWNDPRRVTILLLGIDQRQGEQGPFRTDTMMVLSLNPAAKTGVMLSIPRDIWVRYPLSLGEGRINSANVVGETNQLPGGGPDFAGRTIEQLLGIRIHFYFMVNFDAFTTLIDALGDVEVCPPEPIDDPKYPDGSYGYLHVTFDAGCQQLGAERLLQYARTRRTTGGDLDRAARQQEVILGIREKILSLGGVRSLIDEAPSIWDSIQDNVRTNLSLQELIELALLAQEIPEENIRHTSIGYDAVYIRPGPSGEDILVPIQVDISALVGDLFR